MSRMAIQRDPCQQAVGLCSSIDKVLSHNGDRGEIYCVWGEFKVHRGLIRQGVRFTLPNCRNAVQWTITTATDDPGCLSIHSTIDQPQHDPDFVDSLQQFVDDWKQGLESGKAGGFKSSVRPAADCLPIYG